VEWAPWKLTQQGTGARAQATRSLRPMALTVSDLIQASNTYADIRLPSG